MTGVLSHGSTQHTLTTQPPPLPAQARQHSPVVGFFLDLLIAIGVLLLVSIACGVAWGVVQGIQVGLQGGGDPATIAGSIGQPSAIAQIWITLVGTGTAALAVYFWRRRATTTERIASWRAARRWSTWGWALLAGLATFAFSVGAGWLGEQAGIEVVPTNQTLIESVLDSHPAFLLVFAVLLAPAYEELLFRRVLFGRLWAAGRPWLGVLLSSAAFALVHEVPGLGGNDAAAASLLWLIYGAMGAMFAWVYWRTGTLWAAIGAHAINNLAACGLWLLGSN